MSWFGTEANAVVKLNTLASICRGDLIVYLTDRTILVPEWREKLLKAFERIGNSGVVSFATNTPSTGAISADYFKKLGFIHYPGYLHYHGDQELGERARIDNKFVECLDIIESTYPKPESTSKREEIIKHDWTLYHIREDLGFSI